MSLVGYKARNHPQQVSTRGALHPGATEIGPNQRPPFGCCLLIWEPPCQPATRQPTSTPAPSAPTPTATAATRTGPAAAAAAASRQVTA